MFPEQPAEPAQVLIQFARQLLEHRVGPIRWLRISGLDAAAQRGEPVVQPDREVEGILVAAVPGLVDGFLDLGDLFEQAAPVGDETLVTGSFQPLLELDADIPNLDDGLVRLGRPVPDLAGEVELLHQVGGGHSLEAGVRDHGEIRRLGDARRGDAHLVLTRRRLRAAGGPGAPEDHAVELDGALVPAVPDEAVESLAGGRQRRTPHPKPGKVRLGLEVGLGPFEPFHQCSAGVVDFHRHRVHFLREVVLNDPVLDSADGRVGIEDRKGGVQRLTGELAKRLDVVEDPEPAAVGAEHHVRVLDHEVADGRIRKVLLQGHPVVPVVPGGVHAVLGSEEEQSLPLRILADGAGEVSRGDPVHDLHPGGAVVGRPEDVGLAVVHLVTVGGHEDRARPV